MPTQANISRWKFRKATAASPATYNDIEEVFSISGLGKTNELVDVTNFDSPVGTKEFIAGLADGSEINVEANYIPNAAQQDAMVAAVNAGTTINFQVAYVGVSPEETFSFAGVPLSWSVSPSPTQQNTISFTVKVSGDIT